MREAASAKNIDLETLCALPTNKKTSFRHDLNLQSTTSGETVIDLVNVLAQKRYTVSPPQEQTRQRSGPNYLSRYWSSQGDGTEGRSEIKQRVIAAITALILGPSPATSKGCRLLLPFLIGIEGMSLRSVIQTYLDFQEVQHLFYNLALLADTEGQHIGETIVRDFCSFMRLPRGDQLLAVIELRDLLEQWEENPSNIEQSPYNLVSFRNDLREYFLPQRWTGNDKPDGKTMFDFSVTFRSDKLGTKRLLGELSWAFKAAHTTYREAECAVGYYFAECGDFRRYLHWTKNSASQACSQAYFNLGESYATGENRKIPKNFRTALGYFLKAERHGFKLAASEIGHCYLKLRDYKKARLWLEKAVCHGPNKYAYCSLGEIYEKGLGVPKSKAIALGYYLTAGDMGIEFAQKAAERIWGRPVTFDLIK